MEAWIQVPGVTDASRVEHLTRSKARARFPAMEASLAFEFWGQVDCSGGPDACWPWTGRQDENGYGLTAHKFGRGGAHRVALEIVLGRPLREGHLACHRCENPICANPHQLHVYEGTHLQNAADAAGREHVAADQVPSLPADRRRRTRTITVERVVAEHQCIVCGLWFRALRSDSVYCSGACRSVAYRRRHEELLS